MALSDHTEVLDDLIWNLFSKRLRVNYQAFKGAYTKHTALMGSVVAYYKGRSHYTLYASSTTYGPLKAFNIPEDGGELEELAKQKEFINNEMKLFKKLYRKQAMVLRHVDQTMYMIGKTDVYLSDEQKQQADIYKEENPQFVEMYIRLKLISEMIQ